MKRLPGLLGVAIVLLLVGTACSGRGGSQTPTGGQGVGVGSVAIDFSLPSTRGDIVSLSEFRGRKAVLLYFSMGPG